MPRMREIISQNTQIMLTTQPYKHYINQLKTEIIAMTINYVKYFDNN